MEFRKIPFAERNPLARARNPSLAGYSPLYPGADYLGAVTPAKSTIMMRAQPDAPPGFPGFFGWLKTEHPDFYNWAVVALPSYVTFTEGHRTGGATLQGLMGLGDDMTALDETGFDPTAVGPIDVTGAAPSIVPIETQTPNVTSTGSPAPSSSVTAQIVSTLAQAAPSILSTVNQQQIFQTQLARAAAGLPPLNTSQYGLVGSGVTGISSGVLFAALGIGALVLMMSGKRG